MTDYNPGDVVRISASFSVDDVPADPDDVVVRIRPQGVAEVTPIPLKDSVGEYHVDYAVPEIAPHRGVTVRYQWEGTGAAQATEAGAFQVYDPYRP